MSALLEKLRYCSNEMTDEEFLAALRELGYSRAVIPKEARRAIINTLLRFYSGCGDESYISLDKDCANYGACVGIESSCDFCRRRPKQ